MSAYGPIAWQVLEENAALQNASGVAADRAIADRWDEVLEAAAGVPPAERLADWLRAAGGLAEAEALGVPAELVAESL